MPVGDRNGALLLLVIADPSITDHIVCRGSCSFMPQGYGSRAGFQVSGGRVHVCYEAPARSKCCATATSYRLMLLSTRIGEPTSAFLMAGGFTGLRVPFEACQSRFRCTKIRRSRPSWKRYHPAGPQCLIPALTMPAFGRSSGARPPRSLTGDQYHPSCSIIGDHLTFERIDLSRRSSALTRKPFATDAIVFRFICRTALVTVKIPVALVTCDTVCLQPDG
jgi:hypothetical protein